MSETTKTTETPKKAAEQTTRSGQAATEAVGKASKDTLYGAGHVAQSGVDRAEEASHRMSETVTETANAAADFSARAAEQSREVMWMGVRSAADVGSRVADLSFGRSHHLLSSATHAMDIYRDASERTAEHVQALFCSYLTFGRGLQAIQHAWLESADQAIEHATHKPQDLLRCKNVVELAEMQRDLYIDALNHAVESTGRLLDLAGRTAQDTIRSLRSHAH